MYIDINILENDHKINSGSTPISNK